MLVAIKITDEDIAYAEQILLPAGANFDEERRAYISDFTTLDLQAVPGSGKTTAILAKLLILEKYLPLENGAGVLVISHTNVAIDEIRNKLKNHCPKLLSYPNYVGTIQGFVDSFLAFPYYAQRFGKKIVRIDSEIYNEAIDRRFKLNMAGFTRQETNNARYYLNSNKNLHTYRFICDGEKTQLSNSLNGDRLNIVKPRPNSKNYQDFTDLEKARIRKWLTDLKISIMEQGILHYDDAYFLANRYLIAFPDIKAIIRERFSLVIVDEMQDMDKHQYDLLEQLFAGHEQSVCYQRVGDKNQAIFNGNAQLDEIWHDRGNVKRLSGSQRLSAQIAAVVKKFALFQPDGFDIEGRNACQLKPYIFTYTAQTIQLLPTRFAELIIGLQAQGNFPENPGRPIKIVAWNTTWTDGETQNGRVRLIDYCPNFSKAQHKPPVDHECLRNYLESAKLAEKSMATILRNIIHVLLKILRLEDIKTTNNHRYSKLTMLAKIKAKNDADHMHNLFNSQIYRIAHQVMQEDVDEACKTLRAYLPDFLAMFNGAITESKNFIEAEPAGVQPEENGTVINVITHNDLQMEITTVHAVKGQTHAATLYLETSYQGKHESEYLFSQLLGQPFNDNHVRHKECTKMAYVGLSRPEMLLAIAVNKTRFDQLLSTIDTDQWEIVHV